MVISINRGGPQESLSYEERTPNFGKHPILTVGLRCS